MSQLIRYTMNLEEPLLSFGDDTIAAINQLEINRFICDVSQNTTHATNLSINQHFSSQCVNSSLIIQNEICSEVNKSLSYHHISNNNFNQLCTQEKCDLKTWGLPVPVLEQYQNKGVKFMFQWQVECLSDADVLDGKNLVYSAPTSAGKTLVAELLIMKTVLEKKKKAIVILPFVSVVREKMFYFQDLLETSGVRVQGLMGSHRLEGGFKNVDIAVCTIEKANSLINRLMEEGSLHLIGIVVIDELHLLGDPFRGYLLELLITKIRYMCLVNVDICVQLVGMSATLPNLDLLASWLDACLYKTDFRPIPLNEYLKVGTTVYNKKLEINRILETKYSIQDDPDNIIQLCLETIFDGHSVLIFCPTKNWCEKLAMSIAKEVYNFGNSDSEIGLQLRSQLNSAAIAEALEQLKACPVGLDIALAKSISFGTAFHHAGLTIEERDIVEGLFRSGIVRVLVATSTLSSGVNLPARRVIIRTPTFHRRPLDVQVYQQMVGRAGRMGKDTEGESILMCNNLEKKVGEQLIQECLNPVTSCLGYGELSSSLKRAILEVVASGVAETPEQVKCYTDCTLLAASHSGLENPIETCIEFLVEHEFIRLQLCDDGTKKYLPTPLGNACLAASMSPDDGLELFQELQKARQCFVLENELHLIYLVTPYSVSAQWATLDWLQIMNLWEKLPPSMRRIGSLIGVDESFMVRALRGTINLKDHKQLHKLSVHRRFYTALALQELVDEVPLVDVAIKFQCSKGMLQSLQQTSSTFAGMVTAFCRRLGWRNLELLVSQFQDRLQFGVHRELCELMRLDILNGPRARALFNAGIKSLGDLASADVYQVEEALHKSVTFQTSKKMDGETAFDAAYRNQLKTIWITGKQGLTERDAAKLLIKAAQTLLQQELGLIDVKWGLNERKNDTTVVNSNDENSINTNKTDHTSVSENVVTCGTVTPCVLPNHNIGGLECCGSAGSSVTVKKIGVSTTYKLASKLNELDETLSNKNSNHFKKCIDENNCCIDDKNYSISKLNDTLRKNISAGIHNQLSTNKLNDTVEESQSFDEESENEASDEEAPISSPVSDIFNSSPDDDINNKANFDDDSPLLEDETGFSLAVSDISRTSCPTISPINTSSNNISYLVMGANPNVPFSLNNSIIESKKNTENSDVVPKNSLSESYTVKESGTPKCSVSEFVSSRFSIDIFASPVSSVSCSSPNLFEDSLVVDSHLCNMLDVSGNKSDIDSKTFGALNGGIRNSSDVNNLIEDKQFNLPLKDNGISACLEKINVKNFHHNIASGKLSEHPSRKLSFNSDKNDKLSRNQILSFPEEVNIQKERENLNKNVSVCVNKKHCNQSSSQKNDIGKCENANLISDKMKASIGDLTACDDFTDSFLQQAFATVCDFTHSDKHSVPKECTSTIGVKELSSPPKETFSFSNSNIHTGKGKDCQINVCGLSVSKNLICSPSKAKQFSLITEKEKQLLGDTFNVIEVERFEENQFIRTKLTFDTGADEDENDLVPSSQSQSDATSCVSIPNCLKQKKKLAKAQLPRAKRQKVEDKTIEKNIIPEKFNIKSKLESNMPWDSFQIVDLCSQRQKFEQFKKDLVNSSHVSFSVACDSIIRQNLHTSIGSKILGRNCKKEETSPKKLICDKYHIVGIALCFGEKIAYYIALDPTLKGSASQTPVTFSEQLDLIERIMSNEDKYFLSAYDIKEQYKVLQKSCSIKIDKEISDPKVAEWMLDPENSEKNLQSLISKYIPTSSKLFKRVGNISGLCSLGLNIRSQVNPRMRACVEAVATWHLVITQMSLLDQNKLLKIYKEIEMPTILCLALMEINGINFNKDEAEKLYTELQSQLSILEQEAFKLAGHYFSLSSRNDVSKVLFKELQLKCNKFTSANKLSTSKDVLIKLKNDHPLPSVILEWRKLHFIMSKVLLPFLKVEVTDRIFGRYVTDTVTGRIHMHEPNLQSIPRNFEIICGGIGKTVSIREAFIPKIGKSFVSADYSQLELRLLGHLSQDSVLIDILKNDQDVFKSVAASWKNIDETEVTDNLRQKAKQVCYGVIYGIGASALCDQLEVTEEEASLFMESFLNAYPGVRKYRQEVIRQCRAKGYVETLFGRKRFLPMIKSPKSHLRAQAERQAVNTTVQGSAADIAKTGMVLVEASLKAAFPNEQIRIRRLRENKRQCIETSTATLVLHLHDELLYEVTDKYVGDVIQIIKGCMEAAANVTVPLPVKIKCGKSWGSLVEIT